MERAAEMIGRQFGCSVLLKGGHQRQDANDLLWKKDGAMRWFYGTRIENPNTHGTGCTLSSAIAANLAKEFELEESVKRAKQYLSDALEFKWADEPCICMEQERIKNYNCIFMHHPVK